MKKYMVATNRETQRKHIMMIGGNQTFCGRFLFKHQISKRSLGTGEYLATLIVKDDCCATCRKSLESGHSPAGFTVGV